jgi:hypothetical protein
MVLPNVRCSFFDQSCNLLRPGDVDGVAGARDFDLVAVGSLGMPAFEVGIRSRFAEVTWEALSVVSLILSGIWHMGRDIHQSGNRWIRPGFSNYASPITVTDKNARSILLSEDSLRDSHIVFKGRLRLLDDADVVAILTGMS